ncbi:cupin domain-containing protein [Paenibacillus aurantiacus]|uniref:Cupin domain-containing protein n=1 Tax=Paenibacillus aurantiacus TaxID=1936118 RepID=A0ABV5KTL0_9BACL
MNSYMDFTSPNVQFFYDLSQNQTTKKDDRNYINALSVNQLNTLGNVSLLDIYLSKSNIVEPHIHQNASELVYLVSGGAIVSLINPFTKKLINIPLAPGQVANVPQGWWHYEIATTDDTHILAIFDAPVPEFIAGSDLLRLTPASVFAHSYCLDERKVKEAFAPITDTVVIGPPAGCHSDVHPAPVKPHPQAHRTPDANYYYAPAISQTAYDANEAASVYGNGWQGWRNRNPW